MARKRILPVDAIVEETLGGVVAKSILTLQDKMQILGAAEMRKQLSNKHLAAKFGVAPDTIKNVIHNEVCKRRARRKRSREAMS